MQKTVREIRSHFPQTRIIVGGAPLTHSIAMGMGANAYARDPQAAVVWLSELKAAA
jgi:5-methyltetrahydrofolate--homocysteine methyltransferase